MTRNRFSVHSIVRGLPRLVDGGVIFVALGCILIGARPLVTSAASARPDLTGVLAGVSLPEVPGTETPPALIRLTAEQRRMSAGESLSPVARKLEAAVGRYREVEDLRSAGKLPCDQLRSSYREVESTWIGYSVARRRAYGGAVPASFEVRDSALYEAVQEVDRGFAASGCRRP